MTTEPTKVEDWRDRMPADVRARLEEQGRLSAAELPDVFEEYDAAQSVAEQQEAARLAWFEQSIPVDYAEAHIDRLAPEAAAVLPFIGGSFPNLVITGPTGTGKTFAAYAVLRAVATQGRGWVWATNATDYVQACSFTGGNPRLAERSARASMLLLDDLGADRGTEFAVEQIGSLLDERRRERRRTIVTTNLSAAALTERYGERIVSRIVGGALIVKLTGSDRRLDQSW